MKSLRKRSLAYHSLKRAQRTAVKEVLDRGLEPAKLIGHRDPAELRIREIFDSEKPKSIQASQARSLFLWPSLAQASPLGGIFQAEIGKQAIVADASIFLKALCASGSEAKVRALARKYWSGTMSLEIFEKYYARKGSQWFRKKGAPETLPRAIESPEILYPHKIKPNMLKKVPFGKYKKAWLKRKGGKK